MSTGYSISDFKVGMKVIFGRGNGEQTEGTVMKVNRAKLKVRQDESRGTMRSYPVGTLWTVPPSLCRPANGQSATPAAPAPVATPSRPASPTGTYRVGDRVAFDHNGTVIQGTVKRVNGKTISVNPDGETSGRYWRVSPRLLRPAGSAAPAAPAKQTPTPTLAVGQTVSYEGFSWSARGMATVTGVVTKVSQNNYEVYGEGRTNHVPVDKVTKAPRRSDAEIVDACLGVYGNLSPENLTCDGEASRSHVRNRYAELQRALKALWKEAGRQIDEGECYRAFDAKRRASK